MDERRNPIMPGGLRTMHVRYEKLLSVERPAMVEVVSWAAGNGDRSENGDYIYGRRRLREIDRELAHLARRMKTAKPVDLAAQPDRDRVFFGATVTLADQDDIERVVTLVGEDEADASDGRISWKSPMAQALKGAMIGDTRQVLLPGGNKEWSVLGIAYPPVC